VWLFKWSKKKNWKNRILEILSGLVRVLSELFNQKCWPRYLESGMIPSIMQGALPQLVDDREVGRERIQLNLVVSFKEKWKGSIIQYIKSAHYCRRR
jgi:hypothetical protein